MFSDILNTLQSYIDRVFFGDVTTSVIAAVIAIIAGMLLKKYEFSQVIARTLTALAVFALVLAIFDLFRGSFDFAGWVGTSLNQFLALELGLILVYFVAFFIVISLAQLIRSMFDK